MAYITTHMVGLRKGGGRVSPLRVENLPKISGKKKSGKREKMGKGGKIRNVTNNQESSFTSSLMTGRTDGY